MNMDTQPNLTFSDTVVVKRIVSRLFLRVRGRIVFVAAAAVVVVVFFFLPLVDGLARAGGGTFF